MPDNNAAVLTREFVPQELHDKEYIKPWLDKPWSKELGAEVFKKLEGAESLIGKRPAIPDHKTAKPEDMEKFFGQFAEEKPEGYEIPLEKDAKTDPNFIKAVQTAFHAGKINKVQAQGFLKVINEYGVKAREAQVAAQKKIDLEFDTLAKTMLGAENKPTMERVKGLIAEHAPSTAKAAVAKLDDNNLLIMAAVIDAIHKKYAPEDDLQTKGGGGAGGTGKGTVQEKRDEAKKLMSTKAYSNWQDAEHESTVAKVNELYKEIAAAGA